jgi:hypothetical protein
VAWWWRSSPDLIHLPALALLHFQNSAGRRVTVAANEAYNVRRGEALDTALDRWLED